MVEPVNGFGAAGRSLDRVGTPAETGSTAAGFHARREPSAATLDTLGAACIRTAGAGRDLDEAVEQSVALLFVPHTFTAFAVSFLLFRVFDIWRPLGAREAQAMPGGIGVVIDDVIAGLPVCGVFRAGAWALHRCISGRRTISSPRGR